MIVYKGIFAAVVITLIIRKSTAPPECAIAWSVTSDDDHNKKLQTCFLLYHIKQSYPEYEPQYFTAPFINEKLSFCKPLVTDQAAAFYKWKKY